MLKTMDRYDFIDAFRQSEERQNEYSYDALGALYDYLDEIEHNSDYLFDMIAICCEWTEYETLEEAVKDYGYQTSHELENNTIVIPFKRGGILPHETEFDGYLVRNH